MNILLVYLIIHVGFAIFFSISQDFIMYSKTIWKHEMKLVKVFVIEFHFVYSIL